MQISILGSSITQFGELWDKSLEDLLFEAMDGAIADADVSHRDIDAIFVANKAGGNFNDQHHLNALASTHLVTHPPATRIEAACASGALAILAAEDALLARRYETVLVVGVEKMTDVSASEVTHILSGAAHSQEEYGSTFPALYALIASAHMAEYGTDRNILSQMAVINHDHGMQNPHAQFHKRISVEDIERSQCVADPLRVLDCSPISDGAAAVILTTKKLQGKPSILAAGHAQDTLSLHDRKSLTRFDATSKATYQALKTADISLDAVSVAEVHDCFTIAQVLALEDIGFAKKGHIEDLLATGISGEKGLMVNPSGGLKACGHPVGATGVKQIAYLSKLLQDGGAEYALAHNVGGTGATAVVHILKK